MKDKGSTLRPGLVNELPTAFPWSQTIDGSVPTMRRRSSILVPSDGARRVSDAVLDDMLRMSSMQLSTPSIEEAVSSVDQTLNDLEFYYGIAKRQILRYQSPTTGLFPARSMEKKIGSVRDSIYCCSASWALYQAYKKIDDNGGKAYELGQCAVFGLQGILYCWMRQASLLEKFKRHQSPVHALHVLFDLDTGLEIISEQNYNHLQVDVVAHYLLLLVQCIHSGLQVVSTLDEVAFIQNLVFYIERAYRTPDFGMWGRGSAYNDGTSEVHASSIGMAKAALESINGCNLFGEHGASWSVIYVDIDAHNRNRAIFETLLPRESDSKEVDASLLPTISFPAFATHDENLYQTTKDNVVTRLLGDHGFKRFKRDGFGSVLEPKSQRFYPRGTTKRFDKVESEWPLFYTYMIIDGVYQDASDQVERFQTLLKRRLVYTDKGDPLMPQYFYVTEDSLGDPESACWLPSEVGSSEKDIFLWGQAMLVISDALATGLLTETDIDPIRRALPSCQRPRTGHRYSNFEVSLHNSIVQIVLIAESRRLQANLNTYGIQTQTPEEIEPVQIWSQWDMVKILKRLGQNEKLGLSGRPPRPIGALGSSKVYRVSGQTFLCFPLIFSASEFYLSHDLALLIDDFRADIRFISHRWRLTGRPTVCFIITEEHIQSPQFPEMLALLTEMRNLKIDNVKISLGRLQNLMCCACIEHLDFSHSIDIRDFEVKPFSQLCHNRSSYSSLRGGAKIESRSAEAYHDFVADFQSKSDAEIIEHLQHSDHLYGKIQLLGVLLQRHDGDFLVDDKRIKTHLEELNRQAGVERYWSAVRYSSSLLRQMIDSISPYVTQILVSGKQVTVGTVGKDYALFATPRTPAEIRDAIYSMVQPYNVIAAVLQQELILYCGKLIATNPELFEGILKVRIGWLLHALVLYREMVADPGHPIQPIENISPSGLRKLLIQVLTKSRAIILHLQSREVGESAASASGSEASTAPPNNPPSAVVVSPQPPTAPAQRPLTVFQVRQLSGCLNRVPPNFYTDIWLILEKSPGGIFINESHLPQEPTLSKMPTDLSFAHLVENMLNSYQDPVRKQLVIECLSVLSKIMRRHPEMQLIENLRVESLIEEATSLFAKDHKNDQNLGYQAFCNASVSHTSAYLGKAIIMNLLKGPNLTQFAVSAAASEFHCHVQ